MFSITTSFWMGYLKMGYRENSYENPPRRAINLSNRSENSLGDTQGKELTSSDTLW